MIKTMDTNQNHIDLIVKFLSGDITHDEIIKLESWIGERTANRNLFNEYKKVWESLGNMADVAGIDVQEEWKKLKGKMNVPDSGRIIRNRPAVERNFNFWFTRIAAILIIGLFLSITVILINRNARYISCTTETTTMIAQLPDGSQVTLNTGSSLKYQKKFEKDQRMVELTGEAYFEVSPDQSRPFIVNTDKIEIKVLGTSFNVNAYKDNDIIEVVVNTGQVAVTKEGEITERIILKSGNRGIFNKSDQSLKLSIIEDPNFLSWKTRQFMFEDRSLEEIILTINRIYNSNILITSDSLKEKRVTTSFNNQSLEAILNVLAATLDLDIRENNGEIMLVKK
jgi:ferric-dicitrate binding protein FerR (iron transport regulator)